MKYTLKSLIRLKNLQREFKPIPYVHSFFILKHLQTLKLLKHDPFAKIVLSLYTWASWFLARIGESLETEWPTFNVFKECQKEPSLFIWWRIQGIKKGLKPILIHADAYKLCPNEHHLHET